LRALDKFFCDLSEDEAIQDVDEELRNLGYDPIILEEKGKEISRRYLTNSPLNWRNSANPAIEAARAKLAERKALKIQDLDRASLVSEIQKILETFGRKDLRLIPAHFRNFDKASESDLLNILIQLQFLRSSKKKDEGK
jgi:hypothetical protein